MESDVGGLLESPVGVDLDVGVLSLAVVVVKWCDLLVMLISTFCTSSCFIIWRMKCRCVCVVCMWVHLCVVCRVERSSVVLN